MTAAAIALGLAHGVRHSVEPDHLATVGMLAQQRESDSRYWRRSAVLGALWGLGHGAGLVLIAVVMIVGNAQLPPLFERGVSVFVGVLLVVLGARGARALWQSRGPRQRNPLGHVWQGTVDNRAAPMRDRAMPGAATNHVRLYLRTLAIGVVHGLGGSSAISAITVLGFQSTGARTWFISAFVFSTMIGMAAASALFGGMMQRFAARLWWRALSAGIAVASCGLGIVAIVAALV